MHATARPRAQDNILKNFTTSCSVILGTLISIAAFDYRPSVQFGWGSLLVVTSAYAYATAPNSDDTSVLSRNSQGNVIPGAESAKLMGGVDTTALDSDVSDP